MGSNTPFANEFIRVSRESIRSQYWPKIRSCVDSLNQDEVQWRPPDGSVPCIIEILQRLSDAAFRTIAALGGVALAPSPRVPSGANAGSEPITKERLIAEIDLELNELGNVLQSLPPEVVGERRTIAGRDITVMEVIMELSEELATSYGEISQIASVVSDFRPTCGS